MLLHLGSFITFRRSTNCPPTPPLNLTLTLILLIQGKMLVDFGFSVLWRFAVFKGKGTPLSKRVGLN